MLNILVLYYSKNGSTKNLARLIARGIETVDGVQSVLRTVDSNDGNDTSDAIVEKSDLKSCSGLVIGSPTHFGNMAAPLKSFLDNTTAEWLNNTLTGKPAGVFTSTSSLHGGQESTLLSMMLPLLHHGMLIAGVPYDDVNLAHTKTGGTPYGPSHVSFGDVTEISDEEKAICLSFGKRIAEFAKKISN